MPSSGATQAPEDLNRIAAYLARRDVESLSPGGVPPPASPGGVRPPVDALVVCGSAVLASVDVAAAAFHAGLTRRLLVSGGVGHSTPYLRQAVAAHPRYGDVPTDGRSESAVIADILRAHHAVPDSAISIEDRSTNCGENAELSVALLAATDPDVRSLLLVQDPTMQRRTHESFRRALRRALGQAVGQAVGVRLWSYAPFIPAAPSPDADHVPDEQGHPVWSMSRFTALVLGEIRRLRDDEQGYGPRGAGFIDHVDIPGDVLDAYDRLAASDPDSVRDGSP